MVVNHKHSGLGLDGEKISFNDLNNKPDIISSTHNHDGTTEGGVQVDFNDLLNQPALAPKVFTAHVLKTNGQGAGDVKVVIGFKPNYVHIFSIYQTGLTRRREESTSWTVSDISGNLTTTTSYIELDNQILQTFESGTSSTIPCVFVRRDTARTQQLFMKSFDSDGFTMNYGTNGTNDVGMHIFALG